MLQFKKHSAKINLRRKENRDIDPLEESRAERVVASDLVSHRRICRDRDMDTRKRKLAGICREGPKQIHLERRDGNGRILTEKESFCLFSHEFHGKKPGKRKQEKRMKRYQDELKQKQMSSSGALLLSVERMREAQSQLRTPYILI